ncbi:MAG: bifunctional phosphopantothenoylcysteine decarboxylase/phosphopantothenate--cysteine ligase CoaBC [Jaaginema sp. PMC 1079.18]|nr:bifunctional phosphopantothenoylcysteine decarboxylase/phosphopantothenate--cysteine ligase CoaBC [Jaaginema sp. PMC 1080.18]MEC4851248.1 bifunctional phosphopantothenoylcysteine decarboxylase/phosphopantothenate--cysteine ligase CoaBC [Jaaginema sp. PMC 1079.18]MEC4866411.1 bifunctional phosphopantothenoylcysteine decarboxylase/phosphopantothenate--cysteine ligase CoaBC [Jaaginema sp. PMC 1078.18]
MSKRILIGIGGGIAAYKVCEVISSLFKAGIEVRVMLTETATAFITPLTVATLSRHPAYTDTDFWQATHSRPLHIELGEWADLLVIAPLTANTLGKLVYGLADNLLTNTVLASRCPVLVAPAMNTEMWEQQAVQRNFQQLQRDSRYHIVGPESGLLACDRVGTGRMAEPAAIIAQALSLLHTQGSRDLLQKRLLISAGGTQEYIDTVRFIGNPSTGKMGIALAQAAIARGANVTLVCGPITADILFSHPNLHLIPVVSAEEMQQHLIAQFPQADWMIMAAAVADVKPATTATVKLPKKDLPDCLPLIPVPDIAADLGQRKQPHQILMGFAAQTGDIVPNAIAKLHRKNLDAIAANPIDKPHAGFSSDTNEAIFIDRRGQQTPLPNCTKLELAHHLLDCLQALGKSYIA